MTEQLIITLTEHKHWGWIPIAYIADYNPLLKKHILKFRLTTENLKQYRHQFSKPFIELINKLNKLDDHHLMSVFSKEKNLSNFIQKTNQDSFENLIRPYIEKTIASCIPLIQMLELPLYFRKGNKTLFPEDKIKFSQQPILTNFIFEKNNTGLLYRMELIYNNKKINLLNKELIILCNKEGWILINHTLFQLNNLDGKKLLPFSQKETITIPSSKETPYLKSFVRKLLLHHDIHNIGFEVNSISPHKNATLIFEKTDELNAKIILQFQYNKSSYYYNPLFGKRMVDFIEDNNGYHFNISNRDQIWEKETALFLINKGFITDDYVNFTTTLNSNANIYQIIELLTNIQSELEQQDINIIFHTENPYFIGKANIHFQIKEQIDWFDVYATVHFGKFEIPFVQLKQHLLHDKREFILPDGTIALIPDEWFSRYKELFIFGNKKDNYLQLTRIHAHLIINENDAKNSLKLGKIKELYSTLDTHNIPNPSGIQAELRPYQKIGYAWLLRLKENNFGGCLADDMGLGKTLQFISFLKQSIDKDFGNTPITKGQLLLFDNTETTTPNLAKDEERLPSLVVLPKSLIHNWEFEINKFAPMLRLLKYTGNERELLLSHFAEYDIIISSYGIIRNDIETIKKIPFYIIALDEAQYIKNPQSKIYKSIIQLQGKHRVCLSGTPIENSLSDLWSQLNFLNPGILGNYSYFKKNYQLPIEKKENTEQKEKLLQMITPFILRRTKQEVAKDLPELMENIIYCPMEDEQSSWYEKIKSNIRNQIIEDLTIHPDKNKTQIHILKGMMQLRLLANHPKMLDHNSNLPSGKLKEIIKNIEKLINNNHKVLIFSSFVRHLNILKEEFDTMNWHYCMLTGKTDNRKDAIDQFQKNDNCPIFLVSLKAGGVGLNLTAADYVFILDPWWNVAAENQAINRAHRIGRKEKVIVYRFISENTIEEKIQKLQSKKLSLSNTFINSKNIFKYLNENQIKDMFE